MSIAGRRFLVVSVGRVDISPIPKNDAVVGMSLFFRFSRIALSSVAPRLLKGDELPAGRKVIDGSETLEKRETSLLLTADASDDKSPRNHDNAR